MTKRAVCVGINDYPYEGNDLNGCVNDAKSWAALLVEHFGFPADNIQILLDQEATCGNILAALQAMVASAKKGDILVFTNSSHGTYVADKDSDEDDVYDEALCPYDTAQNLLLDDQLRALFATLPEKVHLTVISDSCFSGTVTRAAGTVDTPDQRRVRFLNPVLFKGKVLPNPWKASPKSAGKHPETEMKEVLVSGCTNQQYSYDASIDGVFHGAMTYFALKAIQEANYAITYGKLVKRVNALLKQAGYPQNPQLEGKAAEKRRRIFS